MRTEREQRSAVVARVLARRAERLAAVWRQVRFSEVMLSGRPWMNQLDGVVESFIHELGRTLAGEAGSTWSRTRGLLRLAPQRGRKALLDEFATLRRCLSDAVSMFGGHSGDHAAVEQSLQEAQDSALALLDAMEQPGMPAPQVRFGGLVIRLFEHAPQEQAQLAGDSRTLMH
jgi:hypothetical protein